jgi:hypothetical protein
MHCMPWTLCQPAFTKLLKWMRSTALIHIRIVQTVIQIPPPRVLT